MEHQGKIVDIIERAIDAQPYCACGRHTMPVWRDGVIWLECASRSDPPKVRLARLVAVLMAPVHTHARIIDVPPAMPRRSVLAGMER